MDNPQVHVGIIDVLLNNSAPSDFIPYNILLMFAIIFALATWLASKSLKNLRHKEYELEKKVSKLERQHKRDSEEKEEMIAHIEQLLHGDEDDNETVNSS